jgi:hypothetical protein
VHRTEAASNPAVEARREWVVGTFAADKAAALA